MQKSHLLIIPFVTSLAIIIYSWYLSFPLSVNTVTDSVFNHISILYWIGLPLLFVSMFLITITTKNRTLKWIMAVAFVIALYSIYYFYNTMETSDSAWFRGLTENFIKTNSLDASQFYHAYYQWPAFFVLADITTKVANLGLTSYEFLLFAIIGFLMATGLYVYATKAFNRSGFVAVTAFFVVMFLFLNYQAVPFTLAFALLFVLLMLEAGEKNLGKTVTIVIIYSALVLTHAFVPLFFVIYLIIQSAISRSRYYLELFIITVNIYLIVQTTIALTSFRNNVVGAFTAPSEYSSIVHATISSAASPALAAIDAVPHSLSRAVIIAFGILCVAGFILVLVRKKIRKIDISVFLTGAIYVGLGVVLSVLGSRALALVFVPISIGITYLVALLKKKHRKYFYFLVAAFLIFVVFVPMQMTLESNLITFQTKEDQAASNFLIDKYDWNQNSFVLASTPSSFYISPQVKGRTQLDTDITPSFSLSSITKYNTILYSIELSRRLNAENINVESMNQNITHIYDILYNSGSFYLAKKAG